MHVDEIGSATQTSALQTGQCFFVQLDKEPVFAIATEDDHQHRAAVVFSKERGDRYPWIATWNSLPRTALLVRPDAQIRVDPSSLQFGSEIPVGPVISGGGSWYIATAMQRFDFVTVNLGSGETEQFPQMGMFVSFCRWSVGIAEGARWTPVFQYPLPEAR